VVAKVMERFAVSKQETQKFDVERFNLGSYMTWRLGNSNRLRSQTGLELWRN
jgi:hypothetical protein